MLCTTIDDEPRFIELLTTLIKEGTLPSYPAFVKESGQKRKRRRKRYEQEAKEAEEMGKREGLDGGKCIAHCGEFTKLLCVIQVRIALKP